MKDSNELRTQTEATFGGAVCAVGTLAHDDWQWPAPKDWQKLERICHLLFRKVWNDPKAALHGRPGQEQRGVDVYGTPPRGAGVHGVQCKRKDALLNTFLTEKEVLAEVENAKAFQPPLVELTIVTCTPTDEKIQQLAREITQRHAELGLFRVDVLSWTEITARLTEHNLLASVYGFQPVSSALEPARDTRQETSQLLTGQIAIQQQLATLASKILPAADGPAHAKLDLCRSLIESRSFKPALESLEAIRGEEWDRGDARLRFRIATNMGAAYMGLGRNAEAGRLFLEAFEYDKASDKSLANRALGLLMLERPDEASIAAREAIAAHPFSATVWTAYLNVVGRTEPASPLPEPPLEVAEDALVLLARADMLALRKDWSGAETLLRKHLAHARPDPIAPSRLAEVLITRACGGGSFYAGAAYSPAQFALLREAQGLLQQAWNNVNGTGSAPTATHVVSNACALASVLADLHSAEKMLDEGLQTKPDDANLWSWKVRMCVARGDGPGASRALSHLPQNVDNRPMLEASTARANNDSAKAAAVLEAWIHSTPNPEDSADGRCLFADAVCDSDPENAEARFNALPRADVATVARSTAIFSRALRDAGREAAAKPYLEAARVELLKSTDSRDHLLLADTLAEFEEYSAALDLYNRHASFETDTPSLRAFIRCLFALDQRRRLFDLLANLQNDVREKPAYTYYRANLAARIGDLPTARDLLERCLASEEKISVRMLWADTCLRMGDRSIVASWLATVDPASSKLTLEQLIRLGQMLHHVGESERATGVFYVALRRFPHDARPHLGLTTSVMFKGSQLWLQSPTAVVEDTAVTVRDDDGHERTYILEDRRESELRNDELSINSELGRRLMGQTVGAVVEGHSSNLTTHHLTVVSIQHKYLFAAHASMQSFNTRFPESHGLVGVKLPTTGTPEEQIAPILQALQDKSSRTTQIVSLYQRGLPLAALGVMLGINSIEAWQGLRGRSEMSIRVCDGTHQERESAFDKIRSGDRRYILDPISLIQLQELGALGIVERVCGRLAVVQSTLDELRSMVSELDLHRDGYVTMFEREGRYYHQEVTAENVAAEMEKLQSALDWARGHCEIVPAVAKADPDPSAGERLENALGRAPFDTLLAAHGGDFILLCDDHFLRKLARGEFALDGMWIQAVLMFAAREQRYMRLDHYNRSVTTLTFWRHNFTSVSADQLSFAAARARWKVSDELQSLMGTLTLAHSEIQSNVRVVALYLKDLWRKGRGPTKVQARKLTEALLTAVGPGKSPHCETYFALLQQLARGGVLPGNAWAAIVSWYRARFLPPVF